MVSKKSNLDLDTIREQKLSEYTGFSIKKIRKLKANSEKLILDIDIINYAAEKRSGSREKS